MDGRDGRDERDDRDAADSGAANPSQPDGTVGASGADAAFLAQPGSGENGGNSALAGLGAPLSPEVAQIARVVGGLLEQQARDAQAARAQARAVVEAIEGLAKSHEFLGIQLREERARSRWLVVALGVVPVLLGGALFAVWLSGRDDDAARAAERADIDGRLRTLQTELARDQVGELRSAFEERTKSLAADADATRTDLERARRVLDEEREARRRADAAAAERQAQAERDRRELEGMRSDLRSLNELAGAERARADALAKALIEAARGEPRTAGGQGGPTAPAASPAPAPATVPASPPVRRPTPAEPGPATLPSPRVPATPPAPPPVPAATRDPGDLATVADRINVLLDGATGAAKYRLEGIEGISGYDLLGVRLVGRDAAGEILRTVVAPKAEIVVAADGAIRIACRDGHVFVSDRQIPFFDGVYALRLTGTASAWRQSGLNCVRFE